MPSLDDYRWLVTDAAEPWLANVAGELTESRGASVALLTRLRKDLSPERAHLVVEQCVLRARAREKFSQADKMFFTRKGLEQATDERIAEVKARRFPLDPTMDMCCGIGGDLIGLALHGIAHGEHGLVYGVDLDPITVLLAEANLEAFGYGFEGHATFVEDAAKMPPSEFGLWHIDPDRRRDDQRTTTLDHYQPPLETLDRMLDGNPNAAIKLAPATLVPPHWQTEAEREWFGSRGECRQQVAWFGSLRQGSRHKATIVDARGGPRTIEGSPTEVVPAGKGVGRLIYEPHAAVLAAHLTGAICRTHQLAAVSRDVAYLTSDREVEEPALEAFQVIDVLPLDQKQLRAYCRDHKLGRLEIKKRGIDIDPNRLWKAIIGEGDESATLIVTPVGGVNRVIVTRRVESGVSY